MAGIPGTELCSKGKQIFDDAFDAMGPDEAPSNPLKVTLELASRFAAEWAAHCEHCAQCASVIGPPRYRVTLA